MSSPVVPPVTSVKPSPYGPVSLREMLRFHIDDLSKLIEFLCNEEARGKQGAALSYTPGPAKDSVTQELVESLLAMSRKICEQLELPTSLDRVKQIEFAMAQFPLWDWAELSTECRVLRETIISEASRRWLLHVKPSKADFFMQSLDDIVAVTVRFPGADDDIGSAIQCYVYEQPTASVFHSMRVLERGLRALASKLKVDFATRNWQNVINDIEAAIRKLQNTLPSGTKRQATLQFYGEAAKEFTYFKDGWRNYVSHSHANYDEHQALRVLQHVISFMLQIGKRLKGPKAKK